MGNYLGLPVLIIAAALQVSFMPQIRILGGEPDLTFLIVLSWAVNARLEEGIVWAFVGGSARDLLTAAPTGASVLGMLILVFGIDRLRQQVFGIGLIAMIGLVIGGTILQEIIYMGVIALAGYQIRPIEMFSYTLLPTVAYNLVFIWPIYWFVQRVLRPHTEPREIR
jgi:rod shape-determining protein MreD